MPALTLPTVSVQASFLAFVDESLAAGPLDPTGPISRAVATYGSSWHEPEAFQRYLDSLRAEELEETPRPDNFVPTTSLWWIDGDAFLGRLSIRHRLAPGRTGLRNGHIGYEVRPSARRQGHATAMLAAALPWARRIGLESVLLTCDDDNAASRRTIEHNGGVPDEPIEEKLRYWIACA
ncbi:GNAT family N-acetyltransferase [Actinoplanes sp. NPDC051411]|uniref:GNAT family N-acetyltransferase n=1 Tax=Actinoplanes sp. NPDC051411 TaxID=3155522 RepID=UPI003426F312